MGLKVYTGGTFDLYHSGHSSFLRQCAELGQVTVALNTDEFVETYKGKAPVMTFEERREVLLSCRYVTDVVPNIGHEDSRVAIQMVQPNIIAVGSDWARRDYYKQMSFTQDWLDERNIWLCYIPYTEGISTTEIKKRLAWQVK